MQDGVSVQDVDYRKLRVMLKDANQALESSQPPGSA
jgi:hypothetical protein